MSRRRQVEYIRAGLRPPWPRTELPHVAVVGRSNVGKSSLINRLFQRKKLAAVSKTPGKTRSLHFYLVDDRFVLCDLPGYGYAKIGKQMRARWDKAIETYLQSETGPVAVVCLIDGRHPPSELDLAMVGYLRDAGVAWLPVLTKADKVPRGRRQAAAQVAAKTLDVECEDLIWSSAQTGEGVDAIWAAFAEVI